MVCAGRRPLGRLFYWALVLVVGCGFSLQVAGAGASPQSSPATTTVADIVYMADGTAAQGSLIISWPAFATAGGAAVAAGTTNVTLGANGALSVALVPNAGATPRRRGGPPRRENPTLRRHRGGQRRANPRLRRHRGGPRRANPRLRRHLRQRRRGSACYYYCYTLPEPERAKQCNASSCPSRPPGLIGYSTCPRS